MGLSRVRTSVVVLQNNCILAFQAIDPTTQQEYVFLPGGVIESHETAPEAAERETLEETGYKIQVQSEGAVDKEYLFTFDGVEFDCFTIFYLAKLTSPFPVKKVVDAAYHKGVIWTPVSKITETFSYSPEVLSAIRELVFLSDV